MMKAKQHNICLYIASITRSFISIRHFVRLYVGRKILILGFFHFQYFPPKKFHIAHKRFITDIGRHLYGKSLHFFQSFQIRGVPSHVSDHDLLANANGKCA